MVELLFLGATLAGVVTLRRHWTRLQQWHHLRRVYPFALMGWALTAIVVLSHTLPRVSEIAIEWGAIGRILAIGALLVWPVLAVPVRAARWLAGVLVVGFVVLGLLDLAYSRHFGTLFPVAALFNVGQGWDIRESIPSLLRLRDLWLLPTALAGLAVAVGVPPPLAPSRRDRMRRLIACALVIAIGAAAVQHNLSGWRGELVLSHARWARHVGVYSVHVLDTVRTLKEAWSRSEPTAAQLDQVRAHLDTENEARPVSAEHELFGVAHGSNVLVVQLESVQNFVVGARVGGVEVTPFLNSLVETAAYYPMIIDQTGESNTADAEYLVTNGLHPIRQGAVVFRRAENTFVTWPRLLQEAGYTTLSAHPWDRGFWNRAIIHPKYGFTRSLFRRELGGVIEQIGWGSSDAAFYERMLPVLTEMQRPYAAYMITLMSHHPYTFYPSDRRELDVGELEPTMLGAYLHMIHEVDASLRDFMAALETSGALENTLVVVFGDHDARLQAGSADIDAGARELGMSVAEVAQLGKRDPRVDFVPLFIRLPGGEVTGTVAVAGGQMDIGATILFFLGIEQPRTFLGRPLLPGAEGFATRVDGSVIDNTRFFVSQGVDVPAEGLCLRLPERTNAPVVECSQLIERGSRQVEASWHITDLDMAGRL